MTPTVVSGSTDGWATYSSFNTPVGILWHTSGVVYISDWSNHRIRAIITTGMVVTIAGNPGTAFSNGIGTYASFNNVAFLAQDPTDGSIVFADTSYNCIRRLTTSGVVSSIAGSTQFGFLGNFTIKTVYLT